MTKRGEEDGGKGRVNKSRGEDEDDRKWMKEKVEQEEREEKEEREGREGREGREDGEEESLSGEQRRTH